VKVKPAEGGSPVALTTEGGHIEGTILDSDADSVTLSVKGKDPLRVRREDLVEVEYYKKGSTAMGVVGGFAGMGAGLLATALVCVTADGLCQDSGAFWIGMLAGGTLGAMGGAAGDWEPVPVLSQHRVALAVRPVPRGAAVGVRIAF
jgi:hypothetical protein